MASYTNRSGTRWTSRGFEIAALALVFLVAGSLRISAQELEKKGKPASDLSVTTQIFDVDDSNVPYTIESDGEGTYLNNGSGVSSILTANTCNGLPFGDWRFDSRGSATRQVSEGFFAEDAVMPGDPHYQAPANPPYTGSQLQHTWMNVQCTCSANKSMYTMAAGSTIVCPLLNSWNDSTGDTWGMSPAHSFNGFPEVTDAQITCTSAPGGHCVDWLIEPIGAPAAEAVGRVVEKMPCHGKNCNDFNGGDFYMRFRIHVTLP